MFERRETLSKGAGQTFIWENGRQHRLRDYGLPLESPSELEREVKNCQVQRIRENRRKEVGAEESLDEESLSRLDRVLELLEPLSSPSPEEKTEARRLAREYKENLLK